MDFGELTHFLGRVKIQNTERTSVDNPCNVFFPELQDAVEEILPDLLEQQVAVFILADKCKSAETESLKDKVQQASAEPIPKERRSHLNMGSTAVYIYTSGTTGQPLSLVCRLAGWVAQTHAPGAQAHLCPLQVFPRRRRSVTARCGACRR